MFSHFISSQSPKVLLSHFSLHLHVLKIPHILLKSAISLLFNLSNASHVWISGTQAPVDALLYALILSVSVSPFYL